MLVNERTGIKQREIIASCGSGPYAVRSSSKAEDGESSNAGAFDSFLDVPLHELEEKVSLVRQSYGGSQEDQVIVQAMVKDVVLSGVLFTLDPSSGARYFCIEWDQSSRTDSVTSGKNNHPTSVVSPVFLQHDQGGNQRFGRLIEITQSLMVETGHEDLDVEFAMDSIGRWHILQVRPLHSKSAESEKIPSHAVPVEQAIEFLASASLTSSEFPSLGETAFSKMADWNPAELIGDKPSPLAFSLFRSLISDSIWAFERSNFGYKNMRSFPLVVDICGQPFVDLHVSSISLLPSALSEELTCEIVNCQMDQLRSKPELHDKVEFELYLSEYSPKVLDRINEQIEGKDDRELVRESLLEVTKKIIFGGFDSSTDKTRGLAPRFERLMASQMSDQGKLYWLVEDCRRYGTLPFGGVARSAFVATSILRGLFEEQLAEKSDFLGQFFRSISSPAKTLELDQNRLELPDLEEIYGHLRPGTFHNTARNYKESGVLKFRSRKNEPHGADATIPTSEEIKLIDSTLAQILSSNGFLGSAGIPPEAFVNFSRRAIEGREWLKFALSRNVSAALDLVNTIGAHEGFSPEDLSYSEIDVFMRAAFSDEPLASRLNASIEIGRARSERDKHTLLPQVIFSKTDLYSFTQFPTEANFVTMGSVEGEIFRADMSTQPVESKIQGKIVFIESADPGFDWIFSMGISGLVTAFGGANSHMAIRCQELQIPAVIGLGPQQFAEFSGTSGRRVYIDASKKIIELL